MDPPIRLKLGDIVELKKAHPCGANRWELVRLGADLKLKCLGCGREFMAPRAQIQRRIKRILPPEP